MNPYANPYVVQARHREAGAAFVRRRRSRTAHVLRAAAVVTTVILLWALSFQASYAWLAPYLYDGGWTK
ncbi:MAG: hypothetical protein V4515_14525 [Chloroflexota bacterium]